METKWTDNLTDIVCQRLANCKTLKSDIPMLVNAKWLDMKNKGMEVKGFTKEDAVVFILELLDCNSCYFDLTEDEYKDLCR